MVLLRDGGVDVMVDGLLRSMVAVIGLGCNIWTGEVMLTIFLDLREWLYASIMHHGITSVSFSLLRSDGRA